MGQGRALGELRSWIWYDCSMALTEADIEQFIAELQANPQLRDRVRDAILAHDFLALPGIVERLGERIEELAQQDQQLGRRIDQLGRRVDDLAEVVKQLGLKMDRVDGRIGTVEGRLYELDYRDNLLAHLAGALRHVRQVFPGALPEMTRADEHGEFSEAEWIDVHRIDVVAAGQLWKSPSDSPEKLLAIELSLVVDRSDVERAARRAELLRRGGLSAEAAVDGDAITSDAQQLAAELGVTVLVRKVQPAA